MGVYGLTHFVQEHTSLRTDRTWGFSSDHSDRFVIDGNAFVYHHAFANNTNWTHGGQYALMAKVIEDMVHAIRRVGIKPTFFFDGALPADKLPTRIKRYRSYVERLVSTMGNRQQINKSIRSARHSDRGIQYHGNLYLIPPMSLDICIGILRDLGVELYVCDGEADGEIARYAHEVGGYAVSKDSDMHIYPNVGQGYIPLDTIQVGKDGELTASVYSPESLASLLQIRVSTLPLFGSLLGNDYVDTGASKAAIKHWCTKNGLPSKVNVSQWPFRVISLLHALAGKEDAQLVEAVCQELKSVVHQIDLEYREAIQNLQTKLTESVQRYDPASPMIQDGVVESVQPLKEWSQPRRCRQILDVINTQTFWCSVFLEDLNQPSSWTASQTLRQHIYAAVLSKHQFEVTEYVRVRHHLATSVTDLSEAGDNAALLLSSDGPITHGQETFDRVHYTTTKDLDKVHRTAHPILYCLRYYLVQANTAGQQLSEREIRGLVAASLYALAPLLGHNSSPMSPPPLQRRSLHIAAEWQGILLSSYLLAQVLDLTMFDSPGSLAYLYDGVALHSFLQQNKLEDDLPPMFNQLYHAVVHGLEYTIGHSTKSRSAESKPPSLDEPLRRKKKKADTVLDRQVPPKRNPFDLLSFGCSFDD